MAMEIDLTKPLNEDEIKYLVERCRWRDLRTYAANMGLDEPMLPDARGIRQVDPTIGVNKAELPGAYKALALVGEKQAEKAAPDPDAQPPSAPSGVMHGPEGQFPPQTPQPSATAPSERTDWSKLTIRELQSELDRRRKEAEQEDPPDEDAVENLSYTKDDRKDDLVVKLNLDDEAIARAAEEDDNGWSARREEADPSAPGRFGFLPALSGRDMAISDEELAALRRMIDEEDGAGGWSDVALALLAEQNLNTDGTYDLRKTAASVWEAKAATYVELVNTSESGSSRSMAQKFDHAIVMAKQFGASSSGTDTSTTAPRSTKIVRATERVEMGARLDNTLRNDFLAALDIFDGGTVEVRTGSQPAGPGTAATGTLLCTFTLADPAYAAASGGSRVLDADPVLEAVGVADGMAGWARFKDAGGTARMDGTVSATGGGGNLQLATTAITTGLINRITGGTVTMPAGS